jgi:hypothetical protein
MRSNKVAIKIRKEGKMVKAAKNLGKSVLDIKGGKL